MIQDILKQCTVEGLVVKLPPDQLDRKVYEEVKKSLELIGGKWKGGKTSGFVFEQDPTELLAAIAAGENRNLKKEYQFFATPMNVAILMMAKLPAPKSGDEKVLEPSAGDGALIKAFYEHTAFAKSIDCFELMDLNLMKLKKIEGVRILGENFLDFSEYNRYDIIIANPPFTNGQDIEHIRRMYHFCKPGGTIVTLSSPSWQLGSNKKQVGFKQWLELLEADVEEIEAGAFKESGTDIRTLMITITKPQVEPSELQLTLDKCLINGSYIMLPADKIIKGTPLATVAKFFTKHGGVWNKNLKGYMFPNVGDQSIYDVLSELKQFAKDPESVDNDSSTTPEVEDTGAPFDENLPAPDLSEPIYTLPHNEALQEGAKEFVKARRAEKQETKEQKCRICGCTDEDCSQCIKLTGHPCHWVEPDLCSACESAVKTLKSHALHQPGYTSGAFFYSLYKLLDGVDITFEAKRIAGKISLKVLPNCLATVKAVSISGTPDELEEGFFEHIKAPVEAIKGLKIEMEQFYKSIEAVQQDNQEKIKNAEKETPASKKEAPAKKTAAKKTAGKKAPVPVEKKEVVVKEKVAAKTEPLKTLFPQ